MTDLLGYTAIMGSTLSRFPYVPPVNSGLHCGTRASGWQTLVMQVPRLRPWLHHLPGPAPLGAGPGTCCTATSTHIGPTVHARSRCTKGHINLVMTRRPSTGAGGLGTLRSTGLVDGCASRSSGMS